MDVTRIGPERGGGQGIYFVLQSSVLSFCQTFEMQVERSGDGQRIDGAEASILQGTGRAEFETECVLETMVSGSVGNLKDPA